MAYGSVRYCGAMLSNAAWYLEILGGACVLLLPHLRFCCEGLGSLAMKLLPRGSKFLLINARKQGGQ